MIDKQSAPIVYLDDKTYVVDDVKQGGMGRVWLLITKYSRGYDPIYRSRLAVKTFDFTPKHYAIEQELNNWVGLVHPNVLPLIRIGKLNYRLAAIMPWRSGTLQDVIDVFPIKTERDAALIALQIAEGLDYAYVTNGLVHLDLKPANILIKSDSPIQIEISDWGISRIAATISEANWASREVSDQFTAYGAGTPLYMSPERFTGSWKIAPQADMYALGIILTQLLTGCLPFRYKDASPYNEIIAASYFDNTDMLLSSHSTAIRKLIMHCIHPDPHRRPQTYREIFRSLKRI